MVIKLTERKETNHKICIETLATSNINIVYTSNFVPYGQTIVNILWCFVWLNVFKQDLFVTLK